jgi:hypothetical protein
MQYLVYIRYLWWKTGLSSTQEIKRQRKIPPKPKIQKIKIIICMRSFAEASFRTTIFVVFNAKITEKLYFS